MGNYNTLAAVIGAHHELALFRRFATLNAQNILYLQAELVHLESELASLALENSCSKDESPASFQASLFYLKDSSDGENESQWRKVLETREKLKEYSRFISVMSIGDSNVTVFIFKIARSCNTPRSKILESPTART